MLSIIISVIVVALFAANDYFRNQKTFDISKSWAKYAVGLASGFLYSWLTSLSFFKYIEIAGVVAITILFAGNLISTVWGWVTGIFKKK